MQTGPRQTTQSQPNLQPSLTEIDEEHEVGREAASVSHLAALGKGQWRETGQEGRGS